MRKQPARPHHLERASASHGAGRVVVATALREPIQSEPTCVRSAPDKALYPVSAHFAASASPSTSVGRCSVVSGGLRPPRGLQGQAESNRHRQDCPGGSGSATGSRRCLGRSRGCSLNHRDLEDRALRNEWSSSVLRTLGHQEQTNKRRHVAAALRDPGWSPWLDGGWGGYPVDAVVFSFGREYELTANRLA